MKQWPAVDRDWKRDGNNFLAALLESAITQGVLWGLAMSFLLDVPKNGVVIPAALFGLLMDIVSAFSLMRVKVKVPVAVADRPQFSELLRDGCIDCDYFLADAMDGVQIFETGSGFKDFSLGPIKVVASSRVINTFTAAEATIAGPYSLLKWIRAAAEARLNRDDDKPLSWSGVVSRRGPRLRMEARDTPDESAPTTGAKTAWPSK